MTQETEADAGAGAGIEADAGVEPPPTGTSVWTANFRLYLCARTTSLLGDAMLPVALSAGVLAAGYGIAGVGFALGAWMGALAVCILFGGVLADRFQPRRMMVLADLVRLLVQSGMAVSFALGPPPLLLILSLQALSGVATAMFQPGVASMVPQVAADVQRGNGVLRIAEALTAVAGPALGGVLVSTSAPSTVFAIDAATYGVSAACLAALRLARAADARTGRSYWSQLVEGWQDFVARAWLWRVIAIFLVFGSVVPGISLPIAAGLVTADSGSTGFGFGMAAFGAGGVLGGLIAMRIRPVHPLAVGAVGWALFSLYPLVPAVAPPELVLCAGWLAAGFGLAFWDVMWATTVQTQIPADLLNRLYAYDVCGSLLALTLGRTLAGPLADVFGARHLMLLSATIGLACTGVLLAAPAIRRLARVT
ncbi:MAG TPA: MFS transporter [Pseudonocardiaceae bacterium]|jgi:MFS family permease|nr:MFS transporter [Pseudonocardiaceae bacterium]